MLHPDILTASYRHRYEIKKIFREALGVLEIDHLSLDLIRPDGEMLYFSNNPAHGFEICSKGYGSHDATVSPEYYKNHEFYWWHEVKHKKYAKEIVYLRQVRHGFKHGFMMVRQWDDFYLIYSFGSSSKDKRFIQQVEASRNDLFAVGDYVYNSMREIYWEYTQDIAPPVIDKFYPYQGGRPEARYSEFYQSNSGILLPKDKLKRIQNSHLRLVVNNDSRINAQVTD